MWAKDFKFGTRLCMGNAERTSHKQFLADRTNGRAYATVFRLSSSVVCL